MAAQTARPERVSDPAKVDAPWLTEVLRYAGVLDHATVAGAEGRRIGTGQMGQNFAFALTYDGPAPGAPASIVGKFPSPEQKSREAAKTFRTYEREIGFYREIAETVAICVPRCYLADIDPATGDFVLLLEDLRPAVQGDQLKGCTVAQAALAMDELAALHAPRWDDPALADIEWLGGYDEPGAGDMLQPVYRGLWPGFVRQYESVLTPEAIMLGEAFGVRLNDWRRSATPPYCVTHGDYRIDNMLFGTEHGGYPLTTVDWQTVGHGPGISDAAYFLGNGLQVPERRAHEMDLLRRYYDALSARGVRGFAWERCLQDYKRATLAGVLMTVIASQVVASNERGVAMFAAMAERHFAHALDHDAGAMLGAL